MSRGRKRLFIVLAVVLLSFGLMTYQYSFSGNLNIRFISYPFNLFGSLIADLKHSFKDLINTYRDNARLREQLSALMVERQQYGNIIEENKRLREIVGFRPQGFKVLTTARVVGRAYDSMMELLIIDKGAQDGIKKGMAVITVKGLLGKIHAAHSSYSEVLLLRDPNFSVAVRIQESRVEGVLSGTGYNYTVLNYIPPEEKVEKGDIVVSSGLDGLFPTGIPIGVVSEVTKDNVEFFQNIKVIPYQYDTKAEEAMVIVR